MYLTRHEARNYTLPTDEIYRYLSTFEVEERWRSERDLTRQTDLYRLQQTLAILPIGQSGAKLLEVGASPWLMTLLLKRYIHYHVFIADFLGTDCPSKVPIHKYNPENNEEHIFESDNFNVEVDHFPYPNGFFDIVLCCELIEHLALDPTHMLVETHQS